MYGHKFKIDFSLPRRVCLKIAGANKNAVK